MPEPVDGRLRPHPLTTSCYDRLVYPLLHVFGRVLLLPLFRLRVTRARSIPRKGPVIVVANHASMLDGVVLHAVTWRPMRVLVAREWAEWGLLRPFFRLVGAIPVDRSEKRNADALGAARAALERGQALALFPEGGLQVDGRLAQLRHGAARLAIETGAPVFPCAIIGAFEAMPWPARLPRPRRITVRCGEPLSFGRSGPPPTHAVAEATERIRASISSLLALGH